RLDGRQRDTPAMGPGRPRIVHGSDPRPLGTPALSRQPRETFTTMKIRDRWPKDWPLQPIPPGSWTSQRPTYRDASPAIIQAALDRSQHRPTGNWYAFAASRDVRTRKPLGFNVAGVQLVAWRDQQSRLCVGPRACPHLGADLATAEVHNGDLICRWHALCLGRDTDEYRWRLVPSYD